MSKVAELQRRAAELPEPVASEVLDFLEFLNAKRHPSFKRSSETVLALRGSLKGRLSTSDAFAEAKIQEIKLEQ